MIWDYLYHFKKTEKWGDPARMNGLLLLLLDAIRGDFDPDTVVIHCGFEVGGHAKDSQHKLGNATDFHIETSRSFSEQISRMEKSLRELQVFDKVGLGIYPDWKHPGFHLDCRGLFARWGRIGDTYVGYADAIEHAKKKGA
jgi:hypothetical protein